MGLISSLVNDITDSTANYTPNALTSNKKSAEYASCHFCGKSDMIKNFIKATYYLCIPCYEMEKRYLLLFELKEKGNPEIVQISKKIFLGNSDGAKDKEALKRYGITHVLVVGLFLHQFYPNDFVYKTIEVDDAVDEVITLYFKECFEFIDNAEIVFVHCRMGVSRSPSIVIAYLMWKEKMTYKSAREYVKGKRSCINPNEGFHSQLLKFEKQLKKGKALV